VESALIEVEDNMNLIITFIVAWIVNAIALAATAAIVPGVRVKGAGGAVLGAFALGIIALIVKPVLTFLSLPFILLTLGLFYLIVISLCFWLAAALVPGFEVDGLGSGFLGALVLTLVNWLLSFVTTTNAWW
jgi:putative membrane protein